METAGAAEERLTITTWLRGHFDRVRKQIAPCAARAAARAHCSGTPRILDPDDLLDGAALRLLERGDELFPDPMPFSASCRILCSFMLRAAANAHRIAARRRRADSARRADAGSRIPARRPRLPL